MRIGEVKTSDVNEEHADREVNNNASSSEVNNKSNSGTLYNSFDVYKRFLEERCGSKLAQVEMLDALRPASRLPDRFISLPS